MLIYHLQKPICSVQIKFISINVYAIQLQLRQIKNCTKLTPNIKSLLTINYQNIEKFTVAEEIMIKQWLVAVLLAINGEILIILNYMLGLEGTLLSNCQISITKWKCC